MACRDILSNSVSNIVLLQSINALDYDAKLKLKSEGRPMPVFKFDGRRQCKLQEQYHKIPWLCACPVKKALFCFPCLIFMFKKGVWSSEDGVTDLGNFTNLVNRHVRSQSHISAVAALSLLGQVRLDEAQDKSINMTRERHNLTVAKNREMIEHHIRVALFLASQGLSFWVDNESFDSHNRGNFVECLALVANFSHNEMIMKALSKTPDAFTGLSPDVQNDIIMAIHDVLFEILAERLAKVPYVSIIADEIADISTESQLALSIRLVHEGEAYEHLIDIINVSRDRTAAALAQVIIESLHRIGIDDASNIIGQSYDGAANMAGKGNSVQKIIQDKWPSAKFVHCYAHKWNLVIKKACERIPDVGLFFGNLQRLCTFFKASPKCTSLLGGRLPGASPIRWLSRGKSVSSVENKYVEIVDILRNVTTDSKEFDPITRAEADGLVTVMQNVYFVFLLKAFKRILELNDAVTNCLQSMNLSPAVVRLKLCDLSRNMENLRTDAAFDDLWQAALHLDPVIPRVRKAAKRPLDEDSGYVPTEESQSISVRENIRALLFEIIDVILLEMSYRFQSVDRFEWIQLFHPANFDELKGDMERICALVDFLKMEHPEIVRDKEALIGQLTVLYSDTLVRAAISEARDAAALLKCLSDKQLDSAMPFVIEGLGACLSVALISVSCERSFSVLRRIKHYTKSTLSHKRLQHHLMLLSVESKLLKEEAESPDFIDEVIDVFARQKDRGISLLYRN